MENDPILCGKRVTMIVLNPVTNDARVLKEAETLREHGATVRIVALGDGPAIVNGHEVVRVEPRMASSARPRAVRIAQNGLRWYGEVRRLARAGAAEPADVIHAHDLDAVVPARAASRSRGSLLVYDAHELFTEMAPGRSMRQRAWATYERYVLPKADLVIAANEERAEIMRDEYGAPDLPIVIQNLPKKRAVCGAPGQDAVEMRSKIDCRVLLLYQGGFLGGRGIEAVLVGMRYLPDDVHLVVMGPGLFPDEFEALVCDPSVKERVHLWPAVSPERVVEWAAVADVGIVTYLPDCRNNLMCAPNKLYDYAAAGLAIVAADLPPLRRLVKGHGVGTLFVPGNAKSFAGAVEELSTDGDSLRRAREAACDLHAGANWNREAERLVHAYQRILAAK